ncbi:MAG: hypothetical protein ACYDCO_13550 [Armatimonadota bacterium]
MSEEAFDIEAYVTGTTVEAIAEVLTSALPGLTYESHPLENVTVYTAQNTTVRLSTGIQDGFIGVWMTGATPWHTDVALARFLSERLHCMARCDPSAIRPDLAFVTNTFLEIEEGKESLVEWA